MSQLLGKGFVRISAIAVLLSAPISAWSTPITGELAYGGVATMLGCTIEFLDAFAIGTGDLAHISDIDHEQLTIPKPGDALAPSGRLWTDVLDAQNFFTLDSATRTDTGAGSITLAGVGVMSLRGFSDTIFDWSLSFDATDGAFFFSAAHASVPEPGTLALFSIGLAAIGWSRRRRTA